VGAALLTLTARADQTTGSALSGIVKPVFNVLEHGAAGDGVSLDSAALQGAIDAAGAAGGGTVYLPAGTYLSGTLRLRSNVTLHLEAGATLLGSTDIAHYPVTEPALRSYTDTYVCQSLLYAERAERIAIVGRGTVDGQGAAFKAEPPRWGYRQRPYLIRMIQCRNVRIQGITLRNSAMWVQHYLACDDLVIHGITVRSRVNHNNDGINIDGCREVRISDCTIDSGDDAIVLKSTSDRACENVTVTNCVLSTACNGLKLGTESNGGFRNIVLSGCALYDIGLCGIALELVDGGTLERVIVSDIVMQNVGGAIFCRLGNRARPFKEGQPKPGMGRFRDVRIDKVIARGVGRTGSSLTGLPGHPIRNLSLSNIDIVYAGGGTREDAGRAVPELPEKYPEHKMFGTLPAYGFYCRHVDGLTLDNVRLSWEERDERPALICEDVADLTIDAFSARPSPVDEPLIALRDVRRALIRGSRAAEGTGVFLRLDDGTVQVSLIGNDLGAARTPFDLVEPALENALYHAANRGVD
jgi:polygalacturonase